MLLQRVGEKKMEKLAAPEAWKESRRDKERGVRVGVNKLL